jgi:hypothetical protein
MSKTARVGWIGLLVAIAAGLPGCVTYRPVVKPIPRLSELSPELENLTDDRIETYLKADVRPSFPCALAVAKLESAPGGYGTRDGRHAPQVEMLRGNEANGWRGLASMPEGKGSLITQVQLVSPLLCGENPSLKSLRDAGALLHAPLLLVYMQDDNSQQGYNDAAMAYWTFVGLFCVPGNTVGHYTVCQAVLIDTRSGFVLATAEGESKDEENVLPGAVEIAAERVSRESRAQAVRELQQHVRDTLVDLAHSRE